MKTEEQLVVMAQHGDTGAFEQLVRAASARLFKLCFRLLRDEQLADEAVQETFLKAYRKLDQFNGEAKFSTWLHIIAHRTALEFIRKQSRIREEDGLESDQLESRSISPLGALAQGNLQQAVKECLDDMKPDLRVAFMLRHVEGCSIEEISELTQANSNAVKGRIFRAVKILRQQLAIFRDSEFDEERL